MLACERIPSVGQCRYCAARPPHTFQLSSAQSIAPATGVRPWRSRCPRQRWRVPVVWPSQFAIENPAERPGAACRPFAVAPRGGNGGGAHDRGRDGVHGDRVCHVFSSPHHRHVNRAGGRMAASNRTPGRGTATGAPQSALFDGQRCPFASSRGVIARPDGRSRR